MPKASTQSGDIFNNLKAIERSHRTNNNTYWKFECLICGNEHIAHCQEVRRGKIKSCGCSINKRNNNGQWKGFSELSGRTISHYKSNAIKRNISFEVTGEDLWNVFISQNKKCPYTGIDLSLDCKDVSSRTPLNSSLDRIDSKLGYIKGNVQWVYKPINVFKGTFSHEEFINLCKLVYNNHV